VKNSLTFEQDVIDALRRVLGPGTHALHEPKFIGNEQNYVQECITSTYVSSVGPFVDRFEMELAKFTSARRAVAVVNGTAALQVALQVAGVKSGDEVVLPALTFIATANAVCHVGAIPHFADSVESTLGLDPVALREWLGFVSEPCTGGIRNRYTGRQISAVIPMHTFGHPCDMDGLLAIARDFQLILVEDAAESLGSFYYGKHTGTMGMLGVLSFNGNKIITTGGGGAILTNDVYLADYAKHLTTTAKIPHRWTYTHDAIGYNFRMPNINAALGCAQLEQLPNFIASKRKLTSVYVDTFSSINDVKLMVEPKGCLSNYWLQTLILSESFTNKIDRVLKATNDDGLMTRPAWTLISTLEPYKNCPQAPLHTAKLLASQIVNLPSSAGIV
jgi:perosamine synthetase